MRTSLSALFGRVVRDRRIAAGLSQEKLAEKAGIHPTYVSLLERGKRKPTLDVADRIANALNVSVARLIENAQHHNRSPKMRAR
jgi:transcriptional regulator with XRE-family HTH domain